MVLGFSDKVVDGMEYTVAATGARCPAVCATNVLDQYCAQLPGNTGSVDLFYEASYDVKHI